MTLLSFVTQQELDDLSEDPRMAFMELVNHAQRRLSDQTSKLDPEERSDSYKQSALEKSFMNVIVAAGKDFEIEPFASMVVPRLESYQNSDYEQFKSDLDHYLTQLILRNRLSARSTSVEILPLSKDRIRAYVHGLRECLEKGNIQPAKRQALLDRLDAFEKELEKRRTSFVSLSLLAIAFASAPGGIRDSVEVTQKLITNITQVFAEAKQTEDDTRQLGVQSAPKELSPPRPPENASDKRPSWESPPKGDLDDEIPF